MQTLTRRLDPQGRVSGVEGYKNGRLGDLDLPSSPEPLNGTIVGNNDLSLPRNVEGHSTLTGGPVIGEFQSYRQVASH